MLHCVVRIPLFCADGPRLFYTVFIISEKRQLIFHKDNPLPIVNNMSVLIKNLQLSNREKHIIFPCLRASEIMNSARQRNIIIFQIFYCLWKGIVIFTFNINIFIAGKNQTLRPIYHLYFHFRLSSPNIQSLQNGNRILTVTHG